MNLKFHNSGVLIDRLVNSANTQDKNVTFLVGSPISMPDHLGGHGVPGVSGMIDLIRNEFQGQSSEDEFERCLRNNSGTPYQNAFEFLHGHRSQDKANEIVRSAVWQALDTQSLPPQFQQISPPEADSAICSKLETDPNNWILPQSVDVFGKLLVTCSDVFGNSVLTTNFDPLIEVSILRHGGKYYRTVLQEDGNLGQTVAEGIHLVHLHGYWHGSDTLHTPQQLIHSRPHLTSSLKSIIEDSILVVVCYSGWDDIITTTLMELLSQSGSTPEIIWTFHDDEELAIKSSNQNLLSVLATGIGRGRVSLYRGIDCLTLFSEMFEKLKPNYPLTSEIDEIQSSTRVTEKESSGSGGQRQLHIEIDIPMLLESNSEPDQPLFIDHWVGRDQELEILTSISTRVVFVTGIGGQGKSALAGCFLKQQIQHCEFWDWRDCREERDRLGTQILRIVERLSDGKVRASQIEVTDIRAIVGMLFKVVQRKCAILVFDNIDQYVDLETLQPVKGLDVLISEAQSRSHNCQFVFTCRPDIQVDESRATRISLEGLSLSETTELIAACGIRKEDQRHSQKLHQMTTGHPLWVHLIAMQAIRSKKGLAGALNLVQQGGATLPDTTKTIWRSLNQHQRIVLRTMAELDRPETESRLFHLIPGINSNRVNKALKTLRSFHLVETRSPPKGEALLGLHPIIREFIKTNFPKKDREKYVGGILDFLNRKIVQFQNLLAADPSYEILEHWIRKAEIKIQFGHFQQAIETILEVAQPLIDRGYPEELIRVTSHLFDEVDWAEACSSYKNFDEVFEVCLKVLIEFGHETKNRRLEKYASAIPGKSAQYVLLCDLKCYANWYFGQFESAIRWGEEGNRLKTSTSVDTRYSTRHHLALSYRDAGRISEAIEYFLEGESIDTVVSPSERIEGKHAQFYGNIGRCLFFQNQLEDTEICYRKSAQLLEGNSSHLERVNRGYIRAWVAELMLQKKNLELAAASFRAAECIWETSSPPRSVEANAKLESLVDEHPEFRRYVQMTDWKVEEQFRGWLNRS